MIKLFCQQKSIFTGNPLFLGDNVSSPTKRRNILGNIISICKTSYTPKTFQYTEMLPYRCVVVFHEKTRHLLTNLFCQKRKKTLETK